MKVWGPEEGRWEQVCAEEILLAANPERASGVESAEKGGDPYCPPAAGPPVMLGFCEWDGRGGRRMEQERGRRTQQEKQLRP